LPCSLACLHKSKMKVRSAAKFELNQVDGGERKSGRTRVFVLAERGYILGMSGDLNFMSSSDIRYSGFKLDKY
jgi:hypothetical protein